MKPAKQSDTTTPACKNRVDPAAEDAPERAKIDQADAVLDTSNLGLLRSFRRCSHLHRLASKNHGQDRVLIVLTERGPMPQSRLAKITQRQPATLCQQLEAMEQAGLVSRAPNAGDRRLVDVSLTPAGDAAAQEAIARRQATADALFSPLVDEADRLALARVLRTLRDAWEAQASPDAPAPR